MSSLVKPYDLIEPYSGCMDCLAVFRGKLYCNLFVVLKVYVLDLTPTIFSERKAAGWRMED